MSHDLRTPMGAILSLAQFGMKESSDDVCQRYFKQIFDSGEYMIGMVHPEYRRLGFAEWIMQEIDGFFAEYAYDDSFILLIANKPADLLYTKHRFEYLSPDRCGMLRNQKK